MIKNIEYVANQRTLIKVKTDKGNFCIRYKDIRPYWDYASSDDFEGGTATISSDSDYLIFTMLTAGGQGVVVCVWDCIENKLIHISEGSYVITATIANNKDESRFLLRIPKITYRRTYIVNSKTAESANKYSQEQL